MLKEAIGTDVFWKRKGGSLHNRFRQEGKGHLKLERLLKLVLLQGGGREEVGLRKKREENFGSVFSRMGERKKMTGFSGPGER